jgi:hypothetical protein
MAQNVSPGSPAPVTWNAGRSLGSFSAAGKQNIYIKTGNKYIIKDYDSVEGP